MIVRSAAKLVSKTARKPKRRRAATILPVTSVPGGKPKHSPSAARIAGAVCTITWLSDLSSAFQTSSIWSRSVMAPTGQTAAHWPHWTQATVFRSWLNAGPITVSKPRSWGNRAPTCCVSMTDAHTAAALDALAAVAGQRGRRGVDPPAGLLARVGDLADAQFRGQGLQFAVLVAVAGLALAVVLGEEQFDDGPAGLADAPGVGPHLHALAGGHRAGGHEVPRPFHFDHADAASPNRLQPFDVAERGNPHASLLRGRKDRGAFGDFDGDVVDREGYHGK